MKNTRIYFCPVRKCPFTSTNARVNRLYTHNLVQASSEKRKPVQDTPKSLEQLNYRSAVVVEVIFVHCGSPKHTGDVEVVVHSVLSNNRDSSAKAIL